ncbi:MAG: PQQ-binding-like beta-propeller repeat protein [Fuerstiella sp.]|nr:PQQ-binding-like beta-propeller repeat protein [Fuerstiella sp.]
MRMILTLLITLNASLMAQDNWSQFRGPTADGHARGHLPLNWNSKTNIAWKTKIHDLGWSSPVIWENQVWLTTALKNGRKLFAICLDRQTGEIIHDLPVFDVKNPQPVAAINSYASPTPAIENNRIYLHYGTYGTACLDTSTGRTIWTRRDLNCDHEAGAGPGGSIALSGNLVLINVDGRDVQYVIALDKATGKDVWKTTRSADYSNVRPNQRKSYCTPTLIPWKDSIQLVSPAAKVVISYDPDTGNELWKVRHRGWSIAPRPVFGHGMTYVIMDHDHPELWAVRLDGKGDVTESHIAWKQTKGMSARSSPLVSGDLIFVVNQDGIATCLESRTGTVVWKNRLKGDYSASLLQANGSIYFFNEDSACTVVRAARKYEILGTSSLGGERLMASPAAAGNSLFVRTEEHLYCIGK